MNTPLESPAARRSDGAAFPGRRRSLAPAWLRCLGIVCVVALPAAPVAIASAGGTAAQDTTVPASAPPSPSRVAYDAAKKAGPLAAVTSLENRRDEWMSTPAESQWFDAAATWRLFVGDHRGALEAHSRASAIFRGGRAPGGPGGEVLEGHTPRKALEAILELAKDRRVLMLNEEHRSGRERAFANELLEPLARAGFTHLALETISDRIGEIDRRGYPLEGDGFYTRDPVLGDLVRRASSLGMRIVAYEADMSKVPRDLDPRDPVARTNWREAEQARNLAALVESDPKARVVVWCGRHHLSEDVPEMPREAEESDSAAPSPPIWTPMGGIFATTTGIDPLTVDLLMMTEGETPDDERKDYRFAVDEGLVREPVIFFDEGGSPWAPIDSIDAAVFFPRTRWDDAGRPSWLAMGGVRKRVNVGPWKKGDDAPKPTAERPLLLEASPTGEAEGAVPVDRVIWREGEMPPLYLRPGVCYRLHLRDPNGDVVSRAPEPLQVD